jgi:hypothetical protein
MISDCTSMTYCGRCLASNRGRCRGCGGLQIGSAGLHRLLNALFMDVNALWTVIGRFAPLSGEIRR